MRCTGNTPLPPGNIAADGAGCHGWLAHPCFLHRLISRPRKPARQRSAGHPHWTTATPAGDNPPRGFHRSHGARAPRHHALRSPAGAGLVPRALQTQSSPLAEVTVAVLDARESERFFGVPMARRGLQPVHLRVVNRGQAPLRLLLAQIDPNYYTPLEAAAANHFSIVKRLSSFGLIGLFFFWMLLLIPSKLITAWLANRRMDDFFRLQALHLRPIGPGEASEGFVFTPLDAGTKIVHVALHATGESLADAARRAQESGPMTPAAEFTFSIPVPGLSADYLRRDFAALERRRAGRVRRGRAGHPLAAMPPATANAKGTRRAIRSTWS